MNMRIMVIYNDTSGKNEGEKIAKEFKKTAENNKDVEKIVLQVTNPDVDEDEIRQLADSEQVDTIVVIGGDGTIHHVLRMLQNREYRYGIIPGGTVNNLAKAVGLPLEKEKAFDVILSQKSQKIDYATVNDDVMISTMTAGILADTASKVSQSEKQKYGPLAFSKRFFHLLFKRRKYALSVKTEDHEWQGKAHLVTIAMTNSMGGFSLDDSASPDDGYMHITIIPELWIIPFFYNLPRILRGQFYKIPEVVYFSAKTATFRPLDTNKEIVTRTDGDPTDSLPVEVNVVPQGMEVFVP
ncbi:diacylglycerol kinase family lipid kinase [Enterococcus saccharolyticus]|uniref:diacylglycerol/lipid kinase family protein n=1 Tax=Enterococcus saccharolyticus TaxID=41997 RepID=UPI001E32BCC4|nr:diacylglycerol kinase family protein [Enterococcus saccharolyticus]MCD5003473.1 diacylglycerol kinase family lipid kinase [Enterococcus saccharolyticus]